MVNKLTGKRVVTRSRYVSMLQIRNRVWLCYQKWYWFVAFLESAIWCKYNIPDLWWTNFLL